MSARNINQEIAEMLSVHKVVLFMKGTPQFPQCGFSGRAIALLKANGLPLSSLFTVNILEDIEMRQGIKEYSNWPTIPQLYINKEFIGGSDIMYEMHEAGELKRIIEEMNT